MLGVAICVYHTSTHVVYGEHCSGTDTAFVTRGTKKETHREREIERDRGRNRDRDREMRDENH